VIRERIKNIDRYKIKYEAKNLSSSLFNLKNGKSIRIIKGIIRKRVASFELKNRKEKVSLKKDAESMFPQPLERVSLLFN